MSNYRIILADDHVILRAGVKKIIQENPGLKVIGEAVDGLELLQMLEESTPDMVILDISMPRLMGLEAIKLIKGLYVALGDDFGMQVNILRLEFIK